ncbi:HPP family protein [Motilimonas sp. E26]|uniref:HPP family protein n=1 Tax=Motilimonas sp. E26 TaxID=2865674 RepID=UPI001E3BE036|nr:HPP family protein [Motilimonas sp. E26]MCE0555958.1 HPP family protein [Motilimonas sp. E26]
MGHISVSLLAGFGAFVAIGLLSLADSLAAHGVGFQGLWLMAPLGATAVLVFGVPASPLAQPKNVIFGHLITATIGVVFTLYIGVTPLTLALATGLAVSAMLVTKTTHPPAGANPILIMLTGQTWWFLVSPVLTGAVTLVLVGWLMRKLQQRFVSLTH